MATGKELVRLMSCGYWDDNIKKMPQFCNAQIFDRDGKPLSMKEAKIKSFCHARIMFKDLTETEKKLLGDLLQTIASTSSEFMTRHIFDFYGIFTEIIIC